MESLSCKIEDKVYADGSQVCEARRCFKCEDGKWVENFFDLWYAGP